MAATIAAAKDQAREVIANGQHFNLTAFIGEWGIKVRGSEVFSGTSFGFFFAPDAEAADHYANRIAYRERVPYRVVGSVSGRDVEADLLGYIAQ